jgi:CRP-like cAMP-binding protein
MALSHDIERLAQVPLLGCLEPDALRLLAFAGESRIIAADTPLFTEGEASDGAYLIVTGRFTLKREHGADTQVEAGSLLGEAGLWQEARHAATAVAVETATVFKLPRTVMVRVLEEHPDSARRLLAFMARRLHTALTA